MRYLALFSLAGLLAACRAGLQEPGATAPVTLNQAPVSVPAPGAAAGEGRALPSQTPAGGAEAVARGESPAQGGARAPQGQPSSRGPARSAARPGAAAGLPPGDWPAWRGPASTGSTTAGEYPTK